MLELRLGCAGLGSRARHARTCSAQRATVAAAIAAAGALAQVTAAEGGRGGGVCGRIQSDARLAWDDGCATHRGPPAPAGRLSWCPSLPWARRRRRLVRRVTSDRLRSARAGAAAVSGSRGWHLFREMGGAPPVARSPHGGAADSGSIRPRGANATSGVGGRQGLSLSARLFVAHTYLGGACL